MRYVSGADPDRESESSREQRRLMREWAPRMQPPDNAVPAGVDGGGVLARTDACSVSVEGVLAYLGGVSFDLVVRLRREPADPRRLHEQIHGRGGPRQPAAHERLLLGVEYADGRRANNLSRPRWHPEPDVEDDGDDALALLVPAGGGGGGGRHYASGYWLTPVPLAGDLTVVCSWPAYGIDEARLVLPAGRRDHEGGRPGGRALALGTSGRAGGGARAGAASAWLVRTPPRRWTQNGGGHGLNGCGTRHRDGQRPARREWCS